MRTYNSNGKTVIYDLNENPNKSFCGFNGSLLCECIRKYYFKEFKQLWIRHFFTCVVLELKKKEVRYFL